MPRERNAHPSPLLALLLWQASVIVMIASTCAVSGTHVITLPPDTPPCVAPNRLPISCGGMFGHEHVPEWTVVLHAFPCAHVLDVGANQGCLTALALGRGATV